MGGVRHVARVLGVALATLGISLLPLSRAPQLQAQPPHNILVFMTDDQTYGTLYAMPAVRRLQERGMTYTQYYDSNPLCCPARATFLTGQYSHNNGVWDVAGPHGGYQALKDKNNTVATWLQQAGYQTAILGKMLNRYRYDRFGVPQGWNFFHVLEQPIYDYRSTRIIDQNGVLTDYTVYRTDLLSQLTLPLIDSFDPGKPWFLWLTPTAPHVGTPKDPYDAKGVRSCSPAPEWRGAYLDAPVPAPRQFNEANVSDKPPHMRSLPRMTQQQQDAVAAAYEQQLECLRSVDEYLDAVVNHLADIGQLASTDIIFTSDNGYAYGEHRVMFGKRLPYAYATHLPLVAAGPDFAHGVDSLPRSSVDLAATIVQLSGATPGRVLDGRSLTTPVPPARPILHEGTDRAFGIARYHSIRTPGLLYTRYRYLDGRTATELYNLATDPDELHALPPYQQPLMQARLAGLLSALEDCAGSSCP